MRLEAGKATEAEHSLWSKDTKGLLQQEGCVYVPREPATIVEILKANHDDPMGSHFGVKCTLEAIQLKYYWDTM